MLRIGTELSAVVFFKKLQRKLSLAFSCLVEMGECGYEELGVPRAVPAAARAGRRYFVKAIAIASLVAKKDLQQCQYNVKNAEATQPVASG